MIVREKHPAAKESTRFFVTTLLQADPQTIVNVLAVRWDSEALFEDWKELFGTDNYPLMLARAIIRYWTFASCASYSWMSAVPIWQRRPRHDSSLSVRHAKMFKRITNSTCCYAFKPNFRTGVRQGNCKLDTHDGKLQR